MKDWNIEEVVERLKLNAYFNDFFNENLGRYSCIYDIDGVAVAMFNEVGGVHASVYFLGLIRPSADIESAQSFAAVCHSYLNSELQKKNQQNFLK